MTLTVADVDRWNAEAVRAVFHAASARGQATLDASYQLGSLAVFDAWAGATAQARQHSNAALRLDLDAHGYEALGVARAADKAADGIEHVQCELRTLRHDAAELHMTIDALTDKVVPSSMFAGLPIEALIAEVQLQPRLDAILAEANAVDAELAAAIDLADGDTPTARDADSVGPQGLTPTQRESDANEERLSEERAKLHAAIDALQAKTDDARAHGDRGRLRQLDGPLRAAQNRLAEFDAVGTALTQAPETYLTRLDIPAEPNRMVRAVVAVGNPDAADDICVTVPGLGSTAKDSLPRMVNEACNLKTTAQKELALLGRPGSVAAIAYLGYDPPPDPLKTISARDLARTISDQRARAGARQLSTYLQRLHANNPTAHISLFGHSYGSLTASLALQELKAQGSHPVHDAVFYGSAGLGIANSSQLGLTNGHAYVMRATGGDMIPELAPLALLHGWGVDPYGGVLPELSSRAGVSPDGVTRSGVSGHGDYLRAVIGPDGEPVLRMSGYNLALVAAGVADLPDGGRQLVMAPTPWPPYPHAGR